MAHAPSPLRSVEEHLDHVLSAVEPLATLDYPLLDALGLPVAHDVRADVALPRFDNSSMDGYAVVHRDVAEASEERPVHLPVLGEIAAGEARIQTLAPGTAVRIMTGAPLPAGADAVVPFEWTSEEGREVLVRQAPSRGQHVRRAGEEVAEGDLLMRAGEVVGTRQVGLLAALGRGRVTTAARPRVLVLSTGAELVEPGRELAGDQIYDSNSFLLAAAVKAHGGVPIRARATSDDPDDFLAVLHRHLLRADLVVTSGGVSMGTRDVVKEALRDLPANQGAVEFVAVAMQPGKPQGFGLIGRERVPIFTLPGNPVSSYVSFETFVVPALRKLTGRGVHRRALVAGLLTEPVASVPGRTQMLRVRTALEGGTLRVTPVGGPGSHLVAGLAGADALAVLDAGVERLVQGDLVPVLLLDPPAGGPS